MRKARSTANGVERTDAQETIAPAPSPAGSDQGDSTIATIVFVSPLQTAAESPAFRHSAPDQSADQRVRAEDGIPVPR